MTADPSTPLTVAEAAERSGVHYMTVYRWIRTGRLPAQRRDGRWHVQVADLDAAGSPKGSAPDGPRRGRPRLAGYRTRLEARLRDADEVGAWAVLQSALTAGCSPVDVHLQLIAPVLREVGDGWASGRVSVAQEHVVSAVATRLVVRLGPQFRRLGRLNGTVVLGAAPGELHVLPMTLLADVLRASGFHVVELGGYTPADVLVEAATRVDSLVAVGIGASTETALEPAAHAARAVRKAVPGVPVLIGGPAVGSEAEATSLGADAWGADGAQVVEVLQGLKPPRRGSARRGSPRPT